VDALADLSMIQERGFTVCFLKDLRIKDGAVDCDTFKLR
jgi:hypothetical protein